MQIDWGDTGSMIAGLAGWAGAVAVVYAARTAFSSWRRQKREERRIDAAERILTLSYRLQRSLTDLRSRQDYTALHALPEGTDSGNLTASEFLKMRRQTAADRLNERVERQRPLWDEVFVVAPQARAFFESDVHRALTNMRARFDGYLMRLSWYRSADDERLAHSAEEIIFEPADDNAPYMDEPSPHDAIAERIKEDVARLEAALLPVIRNDAPRRSN